MSSIEKAIALAAKKHAGQLDKADQPYIFHPLRLMLKFKTIELQIVAVLHDILEDTDTTVVDLISLGFDQNVIDAVKALTKLPNENRIEAAYRAVKNPLARAVKLADVADNMDLSRITHPTAQDLHRIEEYKNVQRILMSAEDALSPS